jgi:hypothetical protein
VTRFLKKSFRKCPGAGFNPKAAVGLSTDFVPPLLRVFVCGSFPCMFCLTRSREGREVLPGWGLHPPQLRVLPQPCVVFAQKRRSAEKAFVGLGVKRSGSLRFCAVGTIRSDYAGGAAGICRPAGARAAGGSVNPGSRPGLPSVAPPALGRGDSTTKRRRSVTVSGVSTENVTPPRSCLVLRGFAASREISSSNEPPGTSACK